MLKGLYDRVMRLSGSPNAVFALFAIAFAESSFFPVPPDVMLAPMVLARREKTWRYALVCTAGSVIGGMLGYAIGFSLEPLGQWLLTISGLPGGEAALRAGFAKWGVGIILLQGLLPVPYKLVTITTGLAHFSLWEFALASCVTRGVRFFGVAALVRQFGPGLLPVIERRLVMVTSIVAALVIAIFVAARMSSHH